MSMTFQEILTQVAEWLQRDKRVSYRALKRQFAIDDDYLDDLRYELVEVQQVADDQDGDMLLWTGESEARAASTPQLPQTVQQTTARGRLSPRKEPSPHKPSLPDAERRQLTVMFCDLADSTRLSGQLDPEDLRDVIRAYQYASSEVIERYGGYIAQHLGDGLMVYFGWPQAHEDDAQRAVHAGLGILETMQGLNARLEPTKGIRLVVRIGIHTGLVVVGEIGKGDSQEHLALGKTPNIASRIEGVAEPDSMAISDATYRLIQGYFVCDDIGCRVLKGVAEPTQVYRVVGASGARNRLEAATARELARLIGRKSEVTLLVERWQQVKKNQGQVVLLSGEAGIGKSRLIQALKGHLTEEAYTRLECRSSPYYQNTALYPIIDFLQRALAWHRNDTPETKFEKLERNLGQYRLQLEEAVPLLATLLSLEIPEGRYPALVLTPQRQRQKTLDIMLSILMELAERQPVLFILEDLHWTDPSTFAFLDLVMERVPTARILTLLTCRPTFQPPWRRRSYLMQVPLDRLSRHQVEKMVEQITGGKALPEAVLQQIVSKTDGVPLYVEEMTKAVLESGLLQDAERHRGHVGLSAALAIPATLQDSLMARLDRLMSAKGIAQLGAVIGRQFSYALIQAVAQFDDVILERELGRLV